MAKFQIKVLNKIADIGLSNFTDSYSCLENCDDYQGLLLRSTDIHHEVFPSSLLAIARAGAGFNNIPVKACSEEGIVVFNTPGANANAVKELVIAALVIGCRNITTAIEWVKTLDGNDIEKQIENGKNQFVGHELYGKKLGVIGLGSVGVLVANAGLDLGMDVYGYDPYLSINSAWNLSKNVRYCDGINEILSNCDFITLHLPYSEKTKAFINEDNLATVKPSAVLLNMARGGLVDDSAILKALDNKKLALYITDFADSRLLNQKNVIIFPHLGASTNESEDNCAIMAVLQLRDYLENGNITNAINLPNITMEKSGKVRISLFHRNIPNMIAQITKVIALLNIENLINKSQDDYAYTLVDVDAKVSDETFKLLLAIEGMLKVRIVYEE